MVSGEIVGDEDQCGGQGAGVGVGGGGFGWVLELEEAKGDCTSVPTRDRVRYEGGVCVDDQSGGCGAQP